MTSSVDDYATPPAQAASGGADELCAAIEEICSASEILGSPLATEHLISGSNSKRQRMLDQRHRYQS